MNIRSHWVFKRDKCKKSMVYFKVLLVRVEAIGVSLELGILF